MLCSPRELAISADHGGILVLLPDLAVGGRRRARARPRRRRARHRGRVQPAGPLSVLGVAREAAAATGAPLSRPTTSGSRRATDAEAGVGRGARPRAVSPIPGPRDPGRHGRPVADPRPGPADAPRDASGVERRRRHELRDAGDRDSPCTRSTSALPGRPGRSSSAGPADGERLVTLDGVERALARRGPVDRRPRAGAWHRRDDGRATRRCRRRRTTSCWRARTSTRPGCCARRAGWTSRPRRRSGSIAARIPRPCRRRRPGPRS